MQLKFIACGHFRLFVKTNKHAFEDSCIVFVLKIVSISQKLGLPNFKVWCSLPKEITHLQSAMAEPLVSNGAIKYVRTGIKNTQTR